MAARNFSLHRPDYFGDKVRNMSKSSHKHMVEQLKAKTTRPDLERFILRRIPMTEVENV
jgi:hypothetical protein